MRTSVFNLESPRSGKPVANQFVITSRADDGTLIQDSFQSYGTIIVVQRYSKEGTTIVLDRDSWDYSKTTGKYRNIFLGEDKKTTQVKIDSGEYKLVDLNK